MKRTVTLLSIALFAGFPLLNAADDHHVSRDYQTLEIQDSPAARPVDPQVNNGCNRVCKTGLLLLGGSFLGSLLAFDGWLISKMLIPQANSNPIPTPTSYYGTRIDLKYPSHYTDYESLLLCRQEPSSYDVIVKTILKKCPKSEGIDLAKVYRGDKEPAEPCIELSDAIKNLTRTCASP